MIDTSNNIYSKILSTDYVLSTALGVWHKGKNTNMMPTLRKFIYVGVEVRW